MYFITLKVSFLVAFFPLSLHISLSTPTPPLCQRRKIFASQLGRPKRTAPAGLGQDLCLAPAAPVSPVQDLVPVTGDGQTGSWEQSRPFEAVNHQRAPSYHRRALAPRTDSQYFASS